MKQQQAFRQDSIYGVLNYLYTKRNGFVTATELGTTNKFFVAATKNFAAATKRFGDRTKHLAVITKYFCYPYFKGSSINYVTLKGGGGVNEMLQKKTRGERGRRST